MRLGMRLHDGDFDEKEREEGEDSGLDEADEELKHHDRDRRDIGQKEEDDKNKDINRQKNTNKTE